MEVREGEFGGCSHPAVHAPLTVSLSWACGGLTLYSTAKAARFWLCARPCRDPTHRGCLRWGCQQHRGGFDTELPGEAQPLGGGGSSWLKPTNHQRLTVSNEFQKDLESQDVILKISRIQSNRQRTRKRQTVRKNKARSTKARTTEMLESSDNLRHGDHKVCAWLVTGYLETVFYLRNWSTAVTGQAPGPWMLPLSHAS